MVLAGAGGAQLITLAFMPILTRLFDPAAFGFLGTFSAIVSILLPLATMAYPISIVLPKGDQEASDLVYLSLILSLGVSVLLLLFAFVFWINSGFGILRVRDVYEWVAFIFLLPFAVLFMAISQTMNYVLIRFRRFNVISLVLVSHSIILNLLKVCVGYFVSGSGVVLMLLGVFGYTINGFLMSLAVKYGYLNILSKSERLLEVACSYSSFPKYRMPQLFVNSMANHLPLVIISFLLGADSAGLFLLAYTIMSAPAVLVGQSLSTVLYPKIVEIVNSGDDIFELMIKTFGVLFLLAAPPFLVLYAFGEYIFISVFGDRWQVSGVIASYLAFSVCAGIVHRPCEAYIQAKLMNKFYLMYEIVCLLLMAAFLSYFSIVVNDLLVVVYAYVWIKILYYVGLVVYVLYISAMVKKVE